MPSRYDDVYARSLKDPETFWAEAASTIHWHRRWDRVLDSSAAPLYRWFPGAEVNTCFNALDRHVAAGRGEQVALIWDSPVTSQVKKLTFRELRDQVALFAGALARRGVGRGDRVLIYMPMIPETVVAMLATARLGAIHSVVFGGFAPKELAKRIDDAGPKVVVSASCGVEPGRTVAYKPLLEEAIRISAHKPERCVIVQRPMHRAELQPGVDLDWDDELAAASPVDCVPVAASDPLYILYTSGTTGVPKGVVRDNGGHLVALDWSMREIYGVQPGEVFWAASDLGWVVGHSYIVYGPLVHGCTTVLYEGKPVGTPDAGAYWRVITDHDVSVLFTAPTAFRAIRREDPNAELLKRYARSRFRTLFLAGERCEPETLLWAREKLQIPVVDHWWQTETGWPMATNFAGLGLMDVPPGSAGKPVPGYRVEVLDVVGQPSPAGQIGAIAVKLPMPPGCLPTLWNNDEGYIRSYLSAYPSFYKTADAGYMDEDGCLWIMSRMDDIINVAGHRLSTGSMEEALASHADVAECAVFGVADSLKGEIPMGLVVLKAGVTRPPADVVRELVEVVRDRIGPVASFKVAAVVKRLPKTRSGKILRGTMKKIAEGQEVQVPATIDDPATLDEIRAVLETLGYPREAVATRAEEPVVSSPGKDSQGLS